VAGAHHLCVRELRGDGGSFYRRKLEPAEAARWRTLSCGIRCRRVSRLSTAGRRSGRSLAWYARSFEAAVACLRDWGALRPLKVQ
jgi:hypothetical protein